MERVTKTLGETDYFRRSPSRIGGRRDHKEWHHFLIHADGIHLLVNFNLMDDPWAKEARLAERARLIVLLREQSWSGEVEDHAAGSVHVTPGGIEARFGASTMSFEDGCYRLSIRLRDRAIAAELELVPISVPAITINQPLSPEHRLSWLFVPRLSAQGTVTIDGRTTRLEGAPAYHDHNWGHFRWGDDFSWEWGSVLPRDAAGPFSVVHVRMLNQGRSVVRYQGLFVWKGREPLRVFRDEEIAVSFDGRFEPARPLQIPRTMALLAPGTANDVPREMTIVARGEGDELRGCFTPREMVQVIMPSERDPEGVTVLNEVIGPITMTGRVRGEPIEMEGISVFEFTRG